MSSLMILFSVLSSGIGKILDDPEHVAVCKMDFGAVVISFWVSFLHVMAGTIIKDGSLDLGSVPWAYWFGWVWIWVVGAWGGLFVLLWVRGGKEEFNLNLELFFSFFIFFIHGRHWRPSFYYVNTYYFFYYVFLVVLILHQWCGWKTVRRSVLTFTWFNHFGEVVNVIGALVVLTSERFDDNVTSASNW